MEAKLRRSTRCYLASISGIATLNRKLSGIRPLWRHECVYNSQPNRYTCVVLLFSDHRCPILKNQSGPMIKSFVFATLLVIATSIAAEEPFTIFEGKEGLVPKQPQACVDSSGMVHVAFGVADQVYYCRIDRQICSVPEIAFRVPNMALGMRRGPRIAHSGRAVVVTAIGGDQGKGLDGDVLAYRSLDDGKTWLGPVNVNDVEASAREGLHAMAASSDGAIWCVWLDLRDKGTKLFASKSTDHGATWTKNVLVYRSPEGSVCECCHPSILADNKSVHVLFRNSLGGNRDMYLVSSQDGGVTFGGGTRLGRNHWTLNACPMDGGMLTLNQNGEISTVWRRDRSILIAEANGKSESYLGIGEQPWVAGQGNEFYTVWTSNREGDLLLARSRNSVSEKISTNASFPIVVASLLPERVAYVIWEKRIDRMITIMGKELR